MDGITTKLLAALTIALAAACTGLDSSKMGDALTSPGTTGIDHSSDSVSTGPLAPTNDPAPVATSSAGVGLSGLAFTADDFTKYSSTADLLGNITVNAGGTGSITGALYHDGVYASLTQLDKSVQYNGHPTMKFSQPGGKSDTPKLGVYFPAHKHIWYHFTVRFSPGFTTTGTLTNSANAYKLAAWGWNGPPDGSGRLEITNTTQYQLYENVQTGPSLIGGGDYLKAGNISTEWTDGGWYDYVIEVDHTSTPGILRVWRGKSGQPLTYEGEEGEKMKDGSPMPQLTNISVGLNFNQVRAAGQNQAVWWGQWEVVDGTDHPNPFGLSR